MAPKVTSSLILTGALNDALNKMVHMEVEDLLSLLLVVR